MKDLVFVNLSISSKIKTGFMVCDLISSFTNIPFQKKII